MNEKQAGTGGRIPKKSPSFWNTKLFMKFVT